MRTRINNGKPTPSGPPYNEIYSAYEPFFLAHFSVRPNPNWPPTTYVSNPVVEKQVKAFVESNSPAIGFLVGAIGIGKTSVLNNLIENYWNAPKHSVLYIDLNRRSAAFRFPENFPSFSNREQLRIATNLARDFVASEICRFLRDKVNVPAELKPLHEYFQRYNPEYLIHEAGFPPTNIKETKKSLQKVAQNHENAYWNVLLKYYAYSRFKTQVIIAVDNCDQKDGLILQALVDVLATLDRCFEGRASDGIQSSAASLSCIISCRPYVYFSILKDRSKSVAGSHGTTAIHITEPCSLSEILRRRYEVGEFSELAKDIILKSKNGITWNIDTHRDFIHKFLSRIENDRHGERILAICNYNVAESLQCMMEIVCNRHFVDLDRVLSELADHGGRTIQMGLPWSQIFNSLAYGNPKGNPVYPGETTRIPNILTGKVVYFPESLFKAQVLLFFIESSLASSKDYSFDHAVRLLTEVFDMSEEAVASQIEELHEEELVESSDGQSPGSSRNQSIRVTPRAEFLWNELGRHSLMLAFYRDDIWLDDRYRRRRTPSSQLSLSHLCDELTQLVEQCLEIEALWHANQSSAGNDHRYRQYLGSTTVTRRLFDGMTSGISEFYEHYLSAENREIVRSRMKVVQSSLETLEKNLQS